MKNITVSSNSKMPFDPSTTTLNSIKSNLNHILSRQKEEDLPAFQDLIALWLYKVKQYQAVLKTMYTSQPLEVSEDEHFKVIMKFIDSQSPTIRLDLSHVHNCFCATVSPILDDTKSKNLEYFESLQQIQKDVEEESDLRQQVQILRNQIKKLQEIQQ